MARRTALLLGLTSSLLSIGCASTPPAASIAYLPALAGDYFPLVSHATKGRFHLYVRLPERYAQYDEARRKLTCYDGVVVWEYAR